MKRQGDILIEKISTIPEGKFIAKESGIVALGEFSGHHHELDGAVLLVPDEKNTAQNSLLGYTTVEKGAELVHQEHSKIDLEPGMYKFTKQREFDGTQTRAVHD